jgi:hypothetical protein
LQDNAKLIKRNASYKGATLEHGSYTRSTRKEKSEKYEFKKIKRHCNLSKRSKKRAIISKAR